MGERNSLKTMIMRKGFVVSMLFQFPNLEECYNVQVLAMMNRVEKEKRCKLNQEPKLHCSVRKLRDRIKACDSFERQSCNEQNKQAINIT